MNRRCNPNAGIRGKKVAKLSHFKNICLRAYKHGCIANMNSTLAPDPSCKRQFNPNYTGFFSQNSLMLKWSINGNRTIKNTHE